MMVTLMLQAHVAKVYKLLLQSQLAMGRRMDVSVRTIAPANSDSSWCQQSICLQAVLRCIYMAWTTCTAAAKGGHKVGSPAIQTAQTGGLTASAEHGDTTMFVIPAGCM